ncbi:hypothetical protein [Dactylosporangium sp. NPDC048998]|uniref:hypothetical protein n=1 Tax=Dactylosporangium sp. NPDC048998 TaxID=3363976 RepID=UPI003714D240
MVEIGALAGSAATAIISAMAGDAWSWVRAELSKLLARSDKAREREEIARLDTFRAELATVAERDVHNRLHGYIEARLGDDTALRDPLFALIQKIYIEVGIDPPDVLTAQQANASNSVVVQAGGDANVVVSAPHVINFTAMTGQEAARRLEAMSLDDARAALANMDPALAARRLAFVGPARARDLLSNVDEALPPNCWRT